MDALRIEAVGGLVEDEHPRVTEQRRCETEPLAHPEREPLHPPIGGVTEADLLEDLGDPALRKAGGDGQDAQVISCPTPGVEAGGLQDRADVVERRRRARRRGDRRSLPSPRWA